MRHLISKRYACWEEVKSGTGSSCGYLQHWVGKKNVSSVATPAYGNFAALAPSHLVALRDAMPGLVQEHEVQ